MRTCLSGLLLVGLFVHSLLATAQDTAPRREANEEAFVLTEATLIGRWEVHVQRMFAKVPDMTDDERAVTAMLARAVHGSFTFTEDGTLLEELEIADDRLVWEHTFRIIRVTGNVIFMESATHSPEGELIHETTASLTFLNGPDNARAVFDDDPDTFLYFRRAEPAAPREGGRASSADPSALVADSGVRPTAATIVGTWESDFAREIHEDPTLNDAERAWMLVVYEPIRLSFTFVDDGTMNVTSSTRLRQESFDGTYVVTDVEANIVRITAMVRVEEGRRPVTAEHNIIFADSMNTAVLVPTHTPEDAVPIRRRVAVATDASPPAATENRQAAEPGPRHDPAHPGGGGQGFAPTAAMLIGTWNADFARALNENTEMGEEERAMAMAFMGMMQLSLTFAEGGMMTMSMRAMGRQKSEEGTYTVSNVAGNAVTITATRPAEEGPEPVSQNMVLTFVDGTETFRMAPEDESEEAIYFNRAQ